MCSLGYYNLKDVLETVSTLILPVLIYIIQEKRINETLYSYENKYIESSLEQEEYINDTYRIIKYYPKEKILIFENICEIVNGKSSYETFSANIVKVQFLNRKFLKSLFIKKNLKKQINVTFNKVIQKNNLEKTLYTYTFYGDEEIKFRLRNIHKIVDNF